MLDQHIYHAQAWKGNWKFWYETCLFESSLICITSPNLLTLSFSTLVHDCTIFPPLTLLGYGSCCKSRLDGIIPLRLLNITTRGPVFFLQKNKSQTVFAKNKGHKDRNILSKVFDGWIKNNENTGFVSWLLGITWHCCCLRRTFKIENDSAHEMSEGTKEIVPWKIFNSFLKWYSLIKLFWSISMAKFGGFNFQKSLWSDPE